jgi:hypothetical protein
MWCYWCCHDFNVTPLSMPYRYDDRRKQFTTTGNYCSWSCMKTHAIDKYGITRGGIICGNISLMRKRLYNKMISVKPAPNRFRNQSIDIEEQQEIITKPLVNNIIPITSNIKKMDEIKNASSTNSNTLKLKRSKPLKRNHNNLESALGLIITPKT